jgi:hypothetical protein
MVEQAKLACALLDMIGYGHIVMCIYLHISAISLLWGMVEQAKLAYTLLNMIGYEHIIMCIYPHTKQV